MIESNVVYKIDKLRAAIEKAAEDRKAAYNKLVEVKEGILSKMVECFCKGETFTDDKTVITLPANEVTKRYDQLLAELELVSGDEVMRKDLVHDPMILIRNATDFSGHTSGIKLSLSNE